MNNDNLLETLRCLQEKCKEILKINKDVHFVDEAFSHISYSDNFIEIYYEDVESGYPDDIFIYEINLEDLDKTTEQLVQDAQDHLDAKERERIKRIVAYEERKRIQAENDDLLKKVNSKEYREYQRLKKIYGKVE